MASKHTIENVVTLLAYDDKRGRLISQLVGPEIFEGDFRVIAERCLRFFAERGEAPKAHLVDELSDVLDKQDATADSVAYILSQMRELWEAGINGDYVLSDLSNTIRRQTMKSEVLRVAGVLHSGADNSLEEAQEMINNLRASSQHNMGRGLRLDNYYEYVESLSDAAEDAITLGIKPLDDAHIVLERETLTVLVAPPGAGKTWFLTHCGVQALNMRKKVLHITLEVGANKQLGRYYQALFSVPKRYAEIQIPELIIRNRKLDDIAYNDADPDFSLDRSSHMVSAELEAHLRTLGARVNNLDIKKYPSGTLTLNMLNAYLDFLESDGFIPDLLIIDYPKIMKLDPRNLRIDLGQTYVGLRGICEERKLAGVVVHQSSKEGAESGMVENKHVSEDYSIVMTCDNVLTFSATETERQYGLGRIYVNKARSERDHFKVLISQSYDVGQFCVSAYAMPDNYKDYLKENPIDSQSADDEDNNEEEEDHEQERASFGRHAPRRGGFIRG